MRGHAASQDSHDREMAEAFNHSDVTSLNAANVESMVHKEFSFSKKYYLKYVRGSPVFKVDFGKRGKISTCD